MLGRHGVLTCLSQYDDVINASADVKKNEKGQEDISILELPTNVRKAQALVKLWESCIPPEYKQVASTISRNALQSGKSVVDEAWFGSEAAEKDAFVTEELYIHSKLMMVDDKKVSEQYRIMTCHSRCSQFPVLLRSSLGLLISTTAVKWETVTLKSRLLLRTRI